MRRIATLLPDLASAAAGGYVLVVRGALTLDLGLGRRVRLLGPITRAIAAPRETGFNVIADPYLGRTPHAMRDKLHVLERSSDMVLAATTRPHNGSPRQRSKPFASSARSASASVLCADRSLMSWQPTS